MKVATHARLGEVFITADCDRLNDYWKPKETLFVEHDGEVLEVSRVLVTDIRELPKAENPFVDAQGREGE